MAKKKRAIILGGGPTAAYAYRALLDLGVEAQDIDVVAPFFAVPSGCFWLHWLPDSCQLKFEDITIRLRGDRYGYAEKQWGDPFQPTSWGTYYPVEAGYRPYSGLNLLWGNATPIWVKPLRKADLDNLRESRNYWLVVQTFSLPEEGIETVDIPIYQNQAVLENKVGLEVEYCGDWTQPWIRKSTGWGKVTWEFPPKTSHQQIRQSFLVSPMEPIRAIKGLSVYNETQYPFSREGNGKLWLRVGSFATGIKDLSHEAYHRLFDSELLRGYADENR